MGTLLRRCVEVRIAIELSFGVVSGVGPGIHVLDGSPCGSMLNLTIIRTNGAFVTRSSQFTLRTC